jgi:hypothetical protein
MIRSVDQRVECNHWEILPESYMCMDHNCIHKNEFCMLCKFTVHFNCTENLLLKTGEFDTLVEKQSIVPIVLDKTSFLRSPSASIISNLLELLNNNIEYVIPKTHSEYLQKYTFLKTEVQGETIKVEFKDNEIYQTMKKEIEDTDFGNKKRRGSFTGIPC